MAERPTLARTTKLAVAHGDVLTKDCDVLVLKYAQRTRGLDYAVATPLGLSERQFSGLSASRHLFIPTLGRLRPKAVLYLGVPDLREFGYADIREFSRESLRILSGLDCAKADVATTVHGAGLWLDEREAFYAQIAGIMEYLKEPAHGWAPESLTIWERDQNRAARLTQLLDGLELPPDLGARAGGRPEPPSAIPDAGAASEEKKHVFVAMPYDDDMLDVYEFGVREPVNDAGCLCERCDQSAFTGDVLDRIKSRISSANVVIADMTGANPNVYLEVGYAWGQGVPTLLIARKGSELLFDVKTHRCIYYKSISDLRKQLTDLLPQLTRSDD